VKKKDNLPLQNVCLKPNSEWNSFVLLEKQEHVNSHVLYRVINWLILFR